jgi:general stress protein 26
MATPEDMKPRETGESREDPRRKILELIRGVRVAMLITVATEGLPGALHARPMYTPAVEPDAFDGDLYFLAHAASNKAREIEADSYVLVSYADPAANRYIVARGYATCEHNPEKVRELWNAHTKAWWPEGPDSPDIALIRVRAEQCEYWDGPSPASYLLSLAKSMITGDRIVVKSDHAEVTLG